MKTKTQRTNQTQLNLPTAKKKKKYPTPINYITPNKAEIDAKYTLAVLNRFAFTKVIDLGIFPQG